MTVANFHHLDFVETRKFECEFCGTPYQHIFVSPDNVHRANYDYYENVNTETKYDKYGTAYTAAFCIKCGKAVKG